MRARCLHILSLVACLFLAACGLPNVRHRPVSKASPVDATVPLVRVTQRQSNAHPQHSGVHVLSNGEDAFAARIALADTAVRSLDLQYYIWKNDLTGKLLIHRLIKAADRGVRVRVLLDDVGAMASDRFLLALDSHPNIEIRLFNPAALRWPRLLGIAMELGRINRRMHNKSVIADGAVAIVGGRNIGDEYFAAHHDMNFNDLDVSLIGPVVREVSVAFDQYWNSPASIEVTRLSKPRSREKDLVALRESLADHARTVSRSPYAATVRSSNFARRWKAGTLPYNWGYARMIYDGPEKVTADPSDTRSHLAPKLAEVRAGARKELFLVSPYFVPGDQGVVSLTRVRQRGARVVVITNSLASTDGSIVHSGYQIYRKALLRAGVEIYELKPTAGLRRPSQNRGARGSSAASMHSKTFAFDRRTLFVGSYNLDPRSKYLNTEIGVLVDCPILANEIPQTLDSVLDTEAYRLVLERGKIVWVTKEGGREVRYTTEPQTSLWRRFTVDLLSLLPIEELL